MKTYYTELDEKEILIGRKDRHLDARQLKEIPVFFVVGRPRSGTTLLRTLFDAHPNAVVPPECQFIINLYPKYGRITNWTEKKLDRFYHELVKQWYFDLWPVLQDRLYNSLMRCAGETIYSTICKVVYNEYQSVFKHGIILAIGDKNPGYAIYTTKLLKIFPEAKFIHIVRDYRDNFVSIRNVDFELPFISLTVSKWRIFVRKFRKASERNPGTHLEIKYEDLVGEPENIYKEICEFIDIPYSSIPFEFYKRSEEALKIYPRGILQKYHSSLFKKISTSRTGLWKKELNPTEVKIADASAGRYAGLTGYERRFNRVSPLIHLRRLPGLCFATLLSVATRIIDGLPYKLRMAILVKAPWVMGRLYLSVFNRKKLREITLALKEKSTTRNTDLKDSGWKPVRL